MTKVGEVTLDERGLARAERTGEHHQVTRAQQVSQPPAEVTHPRASWNPDLRDIRSARDIRSVPVGRHG